MEKQFSGPMTESEQERWENIKKGIPELAMSLALGTAAKKFGAAGESRETQVAEAATKIAREEVEPELQNLFEENKKLIQNIHELEALYVAKHKE